MLYEGERSEPRSEARAKRESFSGRYNQSKAQKNRKRGQKLLSRTRNE